jgi:hypothetical protein
LREINIPKEAVIKEHAKDGNSAYRIEFRHDWAQEWLD